MTSFEVSLSERDRKMLEEIRNLLMEFLEIERELLKMSERFTYLKWKDEEDE